MSKVNVFSTVVFPLIAAPLNGAAIQYLANIEQEDKKKTNNIPIIGKVGVRQFFIGLCYETVIVLILLPFRATILSVFCNSFELKDKWDAHVLASSLLSIAIIGIIVSIKFLYIGNKMKVGSKVQAKRDSSTIKNLIK